MANKLYPKSKAQFLQAGVDLSAVNVRAILVDTGAYTYDDAHDFLDDIPSGARIAVSGNLTGKTFGDDASFNSDDPKLSSAIVIIASVAVTGYDFFAPIVSGVDVSGLSSQVPSWAWPLILISVTALFQSLRNLADKRHRDEASAVGQEG